MSEMRPEDYEVTFNNDTTKPNRGGGYVKYPWARLTEVGAQFFEPNTHVTKMSSAAHGSHEARIKGWKFSCRTGTKELPNGDIIPGVYVTRVK